MSVLELLVFTFLGVSYVVGAMIFNHMCLEFEEGKSLSISAKIVTGLLITVWPITYLYAYVSASDGE